MSWDVLRYAAFPAGDAGGNPALARALDARGMTDEEMLATAAEVGFSETAFLFPAESSAHGREGASQGSGALLQPPRRGAVLRSRHDRHRGRPRRASRRRTPRPAHPRRGSAALHPRTRGGGTSGNSDQRRCLSVEPMSADVLGGDAGGPGLVGGRAGRRAAAARRLRGQPSPGAGTPATGGHSRASTTTTRRLRHSWQRTTGRRCSWSTASARISFTPATRSRPAVWSRTRRLGRLRPRSVATCGRWTWVPPSRRVTIRQGEDMGRPSLLLVDVPEQGGIDVTGAATRL